MESATYHCLACGAPLSFSIEKQNWACEFCLSEFTLEQLSAQTQGQEEKFDEDKPPEIFEDENGMAAFECPNCGGRIITDDNTTATFCVYCHSPAIISSRLRGEGKPKWLIPFKLPKTEAVSAVQKLCKGKPFLPSDFKQSVVKGEVSGLYVPFWLFSSKIAARMKAEGHKVRRWSDSKYNYTETSIYSVLRAAEMDFENIPADGSAKMDDALMEGMEPYDYKDMREFSMEYVSGHFAESFDVDAQGVQSRIETRINSGAQSILKDSAPGYSALKIQDMTVSPHYIQHEYALLPVWTLMHVYGGKRYYFAMNGQTGKMVGKLPFSWKKVALSFGASWLAAFAILLLAVIL